MSTQTETDNSSPDPVFLGDFLVHQIVNDRFGLNDDDINRCVAKLPPSLQQITKVWMIFYLGWLFKAYAELKLGREFVGELLAQSKSRFVDLSSLDKDFDGIGDVFEFWLASLDRSSAKVSKLENTEEVPFEVFAALTFMASDEASPFHGKASTDKEEVLVAGALSEAKRKTQKLIQMAIERGEAGKN